jgi:hypothetical protein
MRLVRFERRRALAPRLHDVAAVEHARGLPGLRSRAGQQVRVAAAHAEAEHGQRAHPRVLQALQVRHGRVDVGQDLLIPQLADAGHHVAARLLAMEEVGRRRDVAVAREVLHLGLDELVEAGAMDHHHDAGPGATACRDVEVHAHGVAVDLDGV